MSEVASEVNAVVAERERCLEIARLEYGYWLGVDGDFTGTGASANIAASIGLGRTVEQVKSEIAGRDK